MHGRNPRTNSAIYKKSKHYVLVLLTCKLAWLTYCFLYLFLYLFRLENGKISTNLLYRVKAKRENKNPLKAACLLTLRGCFYGRSSRI